MTLYAMDSLKRNSVNSLNSQLWHACAGGLVQIPPINSKVIYFPQGHAEHALEKVDFGNSRIPSLLPCKVSAITYMADPHTDEVYVKMRLTPLRESEMTLEDDFLAGNFGFGSQEKPASFAKTLTQSDANNGGGFSVPRYCAETIFPRLDYTAEPPVQTIIAKDMLGQNWKFRHIYRGTPRRHLLTTGWSNFVNHKKLVAGDSIVFLRAENGDLCVGIRRARKGIGGGTEYSYGWSRKIEDENIASTKNYNVDVSGRVTTESVIQAVTLAVNGKPFEVVYYPSASPPEFCIRASAVRAAMQFQWCPGMRFKMPFETEDSSRISWFMGTISSVEEADPIRWPGSPWRLLQVEWDEPDLLQNVKRVNPWLVELVSTIPAYHHLSPFSPPTKKMRFPPQQDVPVMNHFPVTAFANNVTNHGNPFCSVQDNTSTGIQGVRHAQDFSLTKLLTDDFGFSPLDHVVQPSRHLSGSILDNRKDNTCSFLTAKYPNECLKAQNETKAPKATHIFLFGQLIRTEPQSCKSSSFDTSDSEGNSDKTTNVSNGSGSALYHNNSMENTSKGVPYWLKENTKSGLKMEGYGNCKIMMQKEETVGLTTNLSLLGSYDQLHGNVLSTMFGLKASEVRHNVL